MNNIPVVACGRFSSMSIIVVVLLKLNILHIYVFLE